MGYSFEKSKTLFFAVLAVLLRFWFEIKSMNSLSSLIQRTRKATLGVLKLLTLPTFFVLSSLYPAFSQTAATASLTGVTGVSEAVTSVPVSVPNAPISSVNFNFTLDAENPSWRSEIRITVLDASSNVAVAQFQPFPADNDNTSGPSSFSQNFSLSPAITSPGNWTIEVRDTFNDVADPEYTFDSGTVDFIFGDGEAPVIAPVADINLTADALGTATTTFSTTISDNDPAYVGVPVYTGGASGGSFPIGTTTITVSGNADASGNAPVDVTFDIIVTDGDIPVIAPVADINLTADALGTATTTFSTTISDNDPAYVGVPVYTGGASGGSFPIGTTTITVSGNADASGNAPVDVTFDIIVTDGDIPVIAPVADINLTADALGTATTTFSTTISDNDPAYVGVPVYTGGASGGSFPIGTTTITVSGNADASGNAPVDVTFDIIVTDGDIPVIAPVADINLTADALGTATTTFSTTISDNDPAYVGVPVYTGGASGGSFPIGTTTITVSGNADASGNAPVDVTFDIIVTDGEAPVIAPVADINLTADALGTATTTFSTTISDNDPAYVGVPVYTGGASGGSFPIGTTTITVSGNADASGNAPVDVTFDIIVTDGEAPVIAPVADINLTADALGTATTTFSTTISDNDPAYVGVPVYTGGASGGSFPIGTTTITVSGNADASGNAPVDVTFDIIVTDGDIPVIAPVADINLTADASGTATTTFSTTISDNDPAYVGVPVYTGGASGGSFPIGTTTITVSGNADASGNAPVDVTFDIIVTDGDIPVIAPVADINLTADASGTATTTFSTTISDNDPAYVGVPVYTGGASGGSFPIGTTTITVSGNADASGNAPVDVTFDIIVTDGDIPVIAPVADINLTADASGTATTTFSTTISDNDPAYVGVPVYTGGASGGSFPIGTTTITVSGNADASGNAPVDVTFDIIVTDGDIPVIAPVADINLTADASGTATTTFSTTISDNDPAYVGVPVYTGGASGGSFPIGTTTITVSGNADASGNAPVDVTFDIIVTDGDIPVIAPVADINLTADALGTATTTFSTTISDNDPAYVGVPVYTGGASGGSFPIGTTTITVSGNADASGNAPVDVTFDIIVTDGDIPVIAPVADINLTADASGTATTTFSTTISDNDPAYVGVPVYTGGASGGSFPIGTTTITVSGNADASGNAPVDVTFDIIVTDGDIPVISVVAPTITAVGNGQDPDVATVAFSNNATIVDNDPNYAGVLTYSLGGSAITSPQVFAVGTHVITVTGTADAAGNLPVPVTFEIVVEDGTSPTVEITGAPETLSGGTSFPVSITFSESVSGFSASDIVVGNGSVTSVVGSGNTYTAVIASAGTGNVTITVPQGAAQDAAGNDNIVSNTVTVADATVLETQRVIASFIQERSTLLLSNQPKLRRFLSGEASGSGFNLDISEASKTLSFSSANNSKNIWVEIQASESESGQIESSYLFGAVGMHQPINENLLLGGMLEFDYLKSTNANALVKGTGWLAGPYFVAKHPEYQLYTEGRLLFGRSNNKVSPFGTYTDKFKTQRILAQFEVSGEIKKENVTLRPLVDLSYTRDKQLSYVDSLGVSIPSQYNELTEVTVGLDFETPIPTAEGRLELTGGMSGIWADFNAGGNTLAPAPAQEGGRARFELGLNYEFETQSNLKMNAFLDGIGKSDYEAYGVNLSFEAWF